MNSNYTKLLKLFNDWLENQRYSRNTKESYLKIISKFLEYLSKFNTHRLKDPDIGLIQQFITKRGDNLYAESNIRLRQSVLRLFYAWTCTNKYCKTNPIIEHRKSKLHITLPPQKQKMEENKEAL